MRSAAIARLGILLIGSLAASGCFLVAAGGAGAGGGIYFTSRGAESVVSAPGAEAQSAAERALEQFQIRRTELKIDEEAGTRELKGKTADDEIDVTISLSRQAEGVTKVSVTARKNLVKWDKDFAKSLLARIVELSGDEGSGL
ncbi:MAG: DUF3568 family protein [Gemmatimonadota bacterium]